MSQQLHLDEEQVSIMLRRAWDQALRLLSTRVNKPTFETHIRAIKPVSLTETNENGVSTCVVTLGVPSAFAREWVEKRHSAVIAGVLEETLDQSVSLHFVLSPRDTGGSATGQTALLLDPVPSAPTKNKSRAGASSLSEPIRSVSDVPKFDFGSGSSTSDVSANPAALPSTPISGSTMPTQASQERFATSDTPARNSSPALVRERSNSTAGSGGRILSPDAPPLNPRYTFDSFVVGPSNRLAYAGARAVAESPGQVYNPLFLYGTPGLGKTHLMQAIGHEIAARSGSGTKSLRVAYVSAEAFTTQFLTSLREKNSGEFSRRWRSVDVWLVDDVQFITGKERTNEEFFHTFNALYQTGKQIVISSDRSPRELKAMEERLRSRFESGLIADLAPPDLETRLAILQRKAESERARISDDVLLYIAELVQSNIRTLEGALVKLIASASLSNTPITRPLAASVLERYFGVLNPVEVQQPTRTSAADWAGVWNANTGNMSSGGGGLGSSSSRDRIPTPTNSARIGMTGVYSGNQGTTEWGARGKSGRAVITANLVQNVVARHFGMNPDLLTGKKRDKDIVTARQIAIHLTRELTDISLLNIGQMFGGRDHSTVAHACERVRAQLPADEELRGLIENLTTQVRTQASG